MFSKLFEFATRKKESRRKTSGRKPASRRLSLESLEERCLLTIGTTTSLMGMVMGSSVELIAGVNAGGSPPSTGTVTFYDGATAIAGPLSLSGGSTDYTIGTLSTGTHSFTAKYDDSGSTYGSSTSAAASESTTTTTVTSSANPASYGSTVTYTAAVAGDGGGSPSVGSVTFYDNGVTLTSASLSGGSATYSQLMPSAGVHSITASFTGSGGSPGYTSSTSAALSENVVVATTTGLTESVSGSSVTLTASVSSSGGTPTGASPSTTAAPRWEGRPASAAVTRRTR